MKKAVVLLSGGLDSAVTLALALQQERDCYPLFVDYEQAAADREMLAAWTLTHKLGARSAEMMRVRGLISQDKHTGYIPGRNTMLLSLAASFAETKGCTEIWLGVARTGVAKVGSAGEKKWRIGPTPFFQDCCENYLVGMQQALRTSSAGLKNLRIMAPLLDLTKTAIVLLAKEVGVVVGETRSCYGSDKPCGTCPACRTRHFAITWAERIASDKRG